MKKRLLSILLAAVMCLSLLPVGAMATTATTQYNVWVDGVQVTSTNASDVLAGKENAGKVSYDPATSTLTLNGFTKTTTEYSPVIRSNLGSGTTLNLVLQGNNAITNNFDGSFPSGSYGSCVVSIESGNLEISGNGALTITSSHFNIYCIEGNINVNGGTIRAEKTSGWAIRGNVAVSSGSLTVTAGGIGIAGGVTVSGGKLEVSSTGATAISAGKTGVNVAGGELTAISTSASTDAAAISGGVTVNGGKLTANGKEYGIHLGSSYKINISNGTLIAKGETAALSHEQGNTALFVLPAAAYQWRASEDGTAPADYIQREAYSYSNTHKYIEINAPHTHDGEEFTEVWSGTVGSKPYNSGNFPTIYLSGDTTVTGDISIAAGATVNLCLNGHTLDLGDHKITISSGDPYAGALLVFDCAERKGKITSSNADCTIDNKDNLFVSNGIIENTNVNAPAIKSSATSSIYLSGASAICGGANAPDLKISQSGTMALSAKNLAGDAAYTGGKIEIGFDIDSVERFDEVWVGETIVSSVDDTTKDKFSLFNAAGYKLTYDDSGALKLEKDKTAAVVTTVPTAKTLTYTGSAQALVNAGVAGENAKMQYKLGDGVWQDTIPTATNAGEYTIFYKAVATSDDYADGTMNSVTVNIAKATITITAANQSAYVGDTAPALTDTYTVTGLVNNETLKTAPTVAYAETLDMTKAGTATIVVSGAAAPDGGNYDAIVYVNGTLTISNRPSSGGGGGSTTMTTTEKNPDGSTTTTTTNKLTGTVTEDTKYPDGTSVVTITQKDGTGTTEVKISDKAVENADTENQPVTLPLEPVTPDQTAPVQVKLPGSDQEILVAIPVENVTPGIVAVLVKEDGTKEVIRQSLMGEDAIEVVLSGSAVVEIADNSKVFTDINDHWAKDEIDYVTSRELYVGVGNNAFVPDGFMTRGMLTQVLHNLENNPAHTFDGSFPDLNDHWAQDSVYWAAENGIVGGYPDGSFGVEDNISREQLAVMLWRYSGQPKSSHDLTHFSDYGMISSYAVQALAWANENGIVNGRDTGVLDPLGNATRAEVAAMLMRMMEH